MSWEGSFGMTKPSFSSSISVGNVLTIVALVAGVAIAWGRIESKISSESEMRSQQFSTVSAAVESSQHFRGRMDERLRYLEEQVARTDERFTLILTLMSEMKEEIAHLSKKTDRTLD